MYPDFDPELYTQQLEPAPDAYSHDGQLDPSHGVGLSTKAGFPNAAADRQGSGRALDFNALLIQHPSSTYCFRVRGHGHEHRGIYDGDIAVIDRALVPRPDDLVLYFVTEDFIISTFRTMHQGPDIWGVVTAIVHVTRGASTAEDKKSGHHQAGSRPDAHQEAAAHMDAMTRANQRGSRGQAAADNTNGHSLGSQP